ncbi:PhnB protein [Mumia flava]|uniref:PhnB protein n=1 Tax=Mumia flava TaxID=1348852 RepID=A0A0B2BIA0_9ACTN|nr:VOC family protein [Mumia flava]PJJ57944.1 PhnB protein [Mumia flava]
MTARLNPYLSFRDQAREAMEFYQSVLGGELTSSTFAEFQASDDPAEADKIMHSQLETEAGFTLMAADTPSSMPYEVGNNFSVSLSGDAGDSEMLHRYWDGLVDGGAATMPLAVAPWGDEFGMLTDKFGVAWMVNIAGPA